MTKYEAFLSLPNAEIGGGLCFAKVDGKKVQVGELRNDDFYPVQEYLHLLVAEDKPAKRSKKSAPVVESANELEGILDDLNLGE